MPGILIFCKTLLKGGAEKQALTLSKLLTGKKTDVILVAWCGDKIDISNKDFIKNNSIRFIGLRGNSIHKLIHFLKIIKIEKITIILSYLTKTNFIAGICKLCNPELITIGGIRTEKLPSYKFIIEKLVHNYLNDATVFNNFSGKNKFEKRGFDETKIYVIHNTINVQPIERPHKSKDEMNIISVCRFVRSKDFKTALYSFKQLVERVKDKRMKYFIVGYGPLENGIRSLIRNLNLQNQVEVLINPPNIPDIIKACDIYLSTSLFEGLSNSIMEAMVAGLPVIATNVGDNQYLIKDSFNGYIVPCGAIDLIADKLEYLSKAEDVRIEFGNNGHYIIENEFSEEKLMESYFNLFSKMALSPKRKKIKSAPSN
jgi:glycosyltransferase involved in cell wall biosynthesis